MNAELLLSDKYAETSGKIVALHERKKELMADFKKLYEEHKMAMKAIDAEAHAVHQDFTTWAEDHENNKKGKSE